jgi:hypothetical protein
MPRSNPGTFCDQCKEEFGHFNKELNTWTFRVGRGLAGWTFISETSKSKGAIRHICSWHYEQSHLWPPVKPTGIWHYRHQMAYAKQQEMAAANV